MAKKPDTTGVQRQPPKGWVEEFLRWLSACPNVTRACRAAHISTKTAYKHRRRYPTFAARWDEALQSGIAAAEDEAWRRAVHGTVDPVYFKGQVCGHMRNFDNVLLMKMLSAHKPSVYREKLDVGMVVNSAVAGIEDVAASIGLSADQIDALLEGLAKHDR